MKKFEVVNNNGVSFMSCYSIDLLPDDRQLTSLSRAGYKFRVDGKILSLKKIKELKENNNE